MERSKSFVKQKKRRKNKVKELTIIIIIVILIFGGAFYTEHYLNKTSDEILTKLKNLKQNVIAMNEEDNREKVIEQSGEIMEKWDETEQAWAIIVLHDELDLIETSLTKMNSSIENGELIECLEELENAMFLVDHIKQKEKFSLKNIF